MGHVGLVAGAALGVDLPWLGVADNVSPPVDGGHPDSVPCGGRALAVSSGEWGALLSGDVEEGVKEELSDFLLRGGRRNEGGCLDALDGAPGVEA